MKPTVLSLCDESGLMVRPWVEAGHKAVIVDLLHKGVTTEGNITRVGADVREYRQWLLAHPHVKFGIVFAFPPCTDLAVSGARWFKQKGPEALKEALDVAYTCRMIGQEQGCPWMLENPVGRLSSQWRKPDFYFDPDWYAGWNTENPWSEAYRKKTCLWVGGGFHCPGPDVGELKHWEPAALRALRHLYMRPVPGTNPDYIHRMSPGPERAKLRSKTPLGFAYAVYEANKEKVCRA